VPSEPPRPGRPALRLCSPTVPSLLPVRVTRSRPSRLADLAFDLARQAGAEPLAAASTEPSFLLVHAPVDPAVRASLLAALHKRLPAPVRAFTPHEAAIWRRQQPATPIRGNLPTPEPDPDAELRRAAALQLDALPIALAARDHAAVAQIAAAHRALLERHAPPTRFPLIPPADAGLRARDAAALGVFHTALSPRMGSVPGDPPPASAPANPPTAALSPLLADLPAQTAGFDALYLHPGPAGRRHAWRLLGVVADDAPLHVAAALRERLTQHVGILRGVDHLPRLRHPVVLTRAALGALLRGRLFGHPTERLAFQQHRVLLRGEDVAVEHLLGAAHTRDDLRAEAAALLDETAALWGSGATAQDADELCFGSWPTLLALVRGTPPVDGSAARQALAASADPALARVGAADVGGWGSEAHTDRTRPTAFLRDWGPTLLRLQEATLEALA